MNPGVSKQRAKCIYCWGDLDIAASDEPAWHQACDDKMNTDIVRAVILLHEPDNIKQAIARSLKGLSPLAEPAPPSQATPLRRWASRLFGW